jgi:hypothetical protein
MANMKELNRYIDTCIIAEYAEKDFHNGYTLDVDSLPDNERANFLDELMKHDTAVRDLVLCHMQQLIDDRLMKCEVTDRNDAGLRMITLSNGDKRVVPQGRFY